MGENHIHWKISVLEIAAKKRCKKKYSEIMCEVKYDYNNCLNAWRDARWSLDLIDILHHVITRWKGESPAKNLGIFRKN